MIILGVDPGIATVGYGVIEYNGNKFRVIDYGAILTPAKTSLEYRLSLIYADINKLIEKYKPDCMAVEELFFNTNVKTAIAVGHGRGVILLAGEMNGVKVFEYTPLQVKQAVVGYGRAEKNQVMQMTKIILGLENVPKPDDTADALAIAICHAHTSHSAINR